MRWSNVAALLVRARGKTVGSFNRLGGSEPGGVVEVSPWFGLVRQQMKRYGTAFQ